MHPGTFECLLTLATKWKENSAVRKFFHRECARTNSQIAWLEKYLLAAVSTLQSRKASGKLRLDLDLDDYFSGIAHGPTHTPTRSKIDGIVGEVGKGADNTKADVETGQRLLQPRRENCTSLNSVTKTLQKKY